MCWKKWRLGLVIAIICGLLTSGAGLVDHMSWKSFTAVLCAALLTNLLNFLKNHPVEELEDDSRPAAGGTGAKTGTLLLLAVVAGLTTSCAYMHSSTKRATDPKTGIVVEQTSARAYALLDSSAALTKFRNQSSPSTNAIGGTYAPGTYAAGLSDNASSTNVVQVLNALSGVLSKIPW